MNPTERAILISELDKAQRRLKEQTNVIAAAEQIISSSHALPSLKKIAQVRLPKLVATRALTQAAVDELLAVLADPAPLQTDIESVAPPVQTPRRR